jgi:hypothetical protein
MIKKEVGFGILFVILLFIFVAGCDMLQKEDKKGVAEEFKRGPSGLIMQFVPNYPADSYLLSQQEEEISVLIDVRNKGTSPEDGQFKEGEGAIYISGFDDGIIGMTSKSKDLSKMFLPSASPINPLGGFDTVEFDGEIKSAEITIDEYNPTIMATACYPYVTKASPTVCIDPNPFDTKSEKVCTIGSQTLSTQGAPIAVTKIDQEAARNKIQFRIHIKNVGDGDVLKQGADKDDNKILDKCSPLGGGLLGRKDFDRVEVQKIMVGGVDLLGTKKCSPFAEDTNNIMRLFDGEGFVICTLTVSKLGTTQSAYTTPLNIELAYNYRSTISKPIRIQKLTTIDDYDEEKGQGGGSSEPPPIPSLENQCWSEDCFFEN